MSVEKADLFINEESARLSGSDARNNAVMFAVAKLDIKPEEVVAVRKRLNLDEDDNDE